MRRIEAPRRRMSASAAPWIIRDGARHGQRPGSPASGLVVVTVHCAAQFFWLSLAGLSCSGGLPEGGPSRSAPAGPRGHRQALAEPEVQEEKTDATLKASRRVSIAARCPSTRGAKRSLRARGSPAAAPTRLIDGGCLQRRSSPRPGRQIRRPPAALPPEPDLRPPGDRAGSLKAADWIGRAAAELEPVHERLFEHFSSNQTLTQAVHGRSNGPSRQCGAT